MGQQKQDSGYKVLSEPVFLKIEFGKFVEMSQMWVPRWKVKLFLKSMMQIGFRPRDAPFLSLTFSFKPLMLRTKYSS